MFEYLQNEIKGIEQEKRYFEKHPSEVDKSQYWKLMLYVLVVGSILLCPKTQACQFEPKVILEWVCSCGYDNYDGIRYCPLCGSER